MHVRGRLAFGRSPSLALSIAVLALALVGSGTVLAAGGTVAVAPERPEPRAQEPGDTTGFRLPFAAGLEVPIHQGWFGSYSHVGRAAYAYDFGLPEGTPILAAASGVVTHVHDGESACGGAGLLHYANYITIAHADGSATQYGHLADVEVVVGEVVGVGQRIATSGSTGYSGCMPHLHFARQVQGGPVTQSIPVYFEGYPDRPLTNGEKVNAPSHACAPTDEAPPLDGFCGTYRARGADTPAFFSRLDRRIDFQWAKVAPGGYWLDQPVDGFSASWSGRFRFAAAGIYQVRVTASDRVRISIDGVAVFDHWTDRPGSGSLSVAWHLDPGIHRVDVMHEDLDGRGTLSLDWTYLGLDEQDARWSRSGPVI